MVKMGCILDYVSRLLVQCPLHKHHPWRGNPSGGGRHVDEQIMLDQKQLIKACVAHLTVRGASLHCDAVLRRQHKESGKMSLRHLPITGEWHRGVTACVAVVRLVRGILGHNG